MLVKEHNWTPNRYRHGWIPLDGIIAKHKATGVHIEASESPSTGALRLHMISVAPAQRGKGSASAAMRDLTTYADRKGIPMALSPEAHGAGGLTTAALRRWYQRFGFVPNKGRKADLSISESMIRQPIAKQTVSTGSSTGQTVTLNMNTTRLRAYRKLRRKGLPHRQALAMARRVRMAKAAPWDPSKHPRAPAGQTTGGQFSAGGSASAANPARGGAASQRELAALRARLAAVEGRIRQVKAEIAKLSPQQRSQSRSAAARKGAQTRKAKGTKQGGKRTSGGSSRSAGLSPAAKKLDRLQRQLAALEAEAQRIQGEIAKVGKSGVAKGLKMAKEHNWTPNRYRHGWIPLAWTDAQAQVQAAKKAHPDPYGRIPREAEQQTLTTDHPRFFYHSSNTNNRDSILAGGLEAGRSRGGRNTRIYLDSQQAELKRRMDTAPKDQYRVDTQGISLRPDPELPGRWAIAESDLEPTRLTLVATSHPDGLAKSAPYAALHPPIVHHGRINWVDRVGGLPGPIDAIARVLISKGWDESRAVATAVSQAKKQCATGTAIGGHAHLHPASRAVICAAVADWEAKKAAA